MTGKHERFTTAVNDSTGDLIKTKASNQQAYADNWERIFQKPKDSTPKAEQALSRLVDEGVLTDNVIRRHEEMNIGKGKLTQDDVVVVVETPDGKVVVEGYVSPHPLLGLGRELGIEYGDGLEYQSLVREEEALPTSVFVEQLLPEGIIGDEV